MARATNVQPVDGGANFVIEYPIALGAEHRSTVRLTMSPRGRARLNGSGVAALITVCAAYLTPSKATAVQTRAGQIASPACDIAPEGLQIDILPEDCPALAASLTAVVNVAANITL